MDVISQLEDSSGNGSNHLPCISIEGTSARTRSFSFEEIMLRRKRKNVVVEPIKEEPSQFKDLPAKDGTVQTQEYSRDVPETERLSEDPVQGINNSKELTREEVPLDRNRQSSKLNHKRQHDGQMDAEPRHYAEKNKDGHVSNADWDDAEVKYNSEKSTSGRHVKNSRQDYNTREGDHIEEEYEQEIYTKHHKDVSSRDVDMERGKRSERDDRRSHLSEKSVRIKSEIDKSGLTRHDIRKPEFEKRGRRYKEVEYPENKGRRYEREFEYVEKTQKRGRRYEDFAYLEKRGRRYEEFEYPEKKGRRHEESKSKKRPSRSPEYHRKRERSTSVSPRGRRVHRKRSPPISPRERRLHKRRSVSVSPKSRKHPSRKSSSVSPGAGKRSRQRSASTSPPRGQKNSHHGHSGHGYGEESMPHSFRERSSKETSESARIKASKSGGSSRSHGSGLGGYSPRKRKTEAATTILSLHSPDQKVATWDQPPASTIVVNQSLATKLNEFPSSTPTAMTPANSQIEPPSNTPSMLLGTSIDSVQLTQATRPKRRLYIENLPNSSSDKVVVKWLNDFLHSTGLGHYHGNSPCISCIINKERGQALVEFLTPEDATAALSLNGKSFLGSILKVRRPKDFIDTAIVETEKAPDVVEAIHVVSDVVKNSSQKVFIGGISKTLTSGMLMEIVRSLGTLKAYQFEVDEFGEPHVFLEYLDPGVTCDACTSLNGMKLGGQILTVTKVFPDLILDEGHLESIPSNEIPTHAKPLLVKATRVLKLTNVFNMEEFTLLPDAELEEILEDVRIECARFGTVKSINVVHQTSDDPIHVFDQNPQALSSEIAPSDGPSETDIKSPADAATLHVQSLMEDTVGNPSVDGDNLEKEASNPSQVEVVGDALGNSSRDGDNQEKEIDGPPVDVTSSTSVIDDLSRVDVTGNETLEDSVRDANNLESENGSSSQADDAERPSQVVGMVNEEEPGGLEARTPSENMQVSASAEVEDHNPSETVSSSIVVQTASMDAAHVEKSYEGDEEKMLPIQNSRAFEPGCVLVEFMREEAACMAAHFLNRRPYGGRPVEVSYVAHDLYLEQFPR